MCPMTKNEAIQHFGGVSALARALGINRWAIYQWGDRPPEGRQYQLELMTGGALKADKQGKSSSEAGS